MAVSRSASASGSDGLRRRLGDLDRLPAVVIETTLDLNLRLLLFLLLFLLGTAGSERRVEALAQSLNHFTKPVPIEDIEHNVGCEVAEGEPHGQCTGTSEAHDVVGGEKGLILRGDGRDGLIEAILEAHIAVANDVAVGHGSVNVPEDEYRVDTAPDETAEEKGRDKDDAVDELVDATRHFQLVHEPVHVKRWR